jgi:hypothetical protein
MEITTEIPANLTLAMRMNHVFEGVRRVDATGRARGSETCLGGNKWVYDMTDHRDISWNIPGIFPGISWNIDGICMVYYEQFLICANKNGIAELMQFGALVISVKRRNIKLRVPPKDLQRTIHGLFTSYLQKKERGFP